jgi:release factor glutamine methyltransferase
VADLGTGSGAIGLSVVAELPLGAVEVWATDRSPDALDVARANLAGLGRRGTQVRLAQGDWFAALPADLEGRFDLVVANPPYVADGDDLPREVREWEPLGALLAGPDGLDDVRRIAVDSPRWLSPGASLVVEIGDGQGPAAAAIAVDAGLVEVEVRPDLAGRDRILLARRSPRPD